MEQFPIQSETGNCRRVYGRFLQSVKRMKVPVTSCKVERPQEYYFDTEHRPGHPHNNAGALSTLLR